MKVIGITRRMDDLGRVVIPKEMRQSLGINEGDFLEIVGTDRGLLMQKCGEAYGNEPVPKGVETEEKDKIFVFRDQDCMVHLVSLSKKAEELCRWLEELGLLDEDMWWEVCAALAPSECQRPRTNGSIFVIGVLNGRENRCLLLLLLQKVR